MGYAHGSVNSSENDIKTNSILIYCESAIITQQGEPMQRLYVILRTVDGTMFIAHESGVVVSSSSWLSLTISLGNM